MTDKNTLRQQLRQRRQQLSAEQQQQAALAVAKQFIDSPHFTEHSNFSVYISHNGELDPHPIVDALWQAGKHCYLPIIDPQKANHLCFMEYNTDTHLVKNKFGIEEPDYDPAHTISIKKLEVILLPLVAFDKQGYRLGRGAGFYDRTFSERATAKTPLLIGLAHDFQYVDTLPTDPWDIPLDVVINNQKNVLPLNK